MRITSEMFHDLEAALGPDAQVIIDIYPGGCRISIEWDEGLSQFGVTLGVEGVTKLSSYGEAERNAAWKRLIQKLVDAKAGKLKDTSPL